MSERIEPLLDADAGGGLADDALLQSLVWLTRHHGRERSAQSLLSGVSLSGALGPDQALRILREAGFNAGMIQRRLADIHSLLLPAVLLLRHGDACIVVARHAPGPDGTVQYDVVMPGPSQHAVKAGEAELNAAYTGLALVASPKPQQAAGPPHTHEALRDPGSHWLWGTLRRFIPYYRASLLAALLSNVLMLGTGLVTSVVYDKVIPHQAFVTLWALATGAFIALAFDRFDQQALQVGLV
ncbi:MAG TPA: type I secretion system permease/ATPase, partial [Burkholderiaceae bacterium]|nr:type I secretion system permease/ATPase [Burkholderiaceae bacterium]